MMMVKTTPYLHQGESTSGELSLLYMPIPPFVVDPDALIFHRGH
jgi:hypothetical protein